jgi:hypothetical protein
MPLSQILNDQSVPPTQVRRTSQRRTIEILECARTGNRTSAHEIGEITLGPKLPRLMVRMEVGVAHTLGPRHLTQRCVRSELALRITQAVKKNAELLQIGRKLGRWRTTLVLVHLRPCLDSVRPMNGSRSAAHL